MNKNYLRYLTDNYLGKEHSISEAINTSYPWFFPPNYDLLSNDEATLFNKKIRDKNLKHAFVFPKKGHFSEISKALKVMLKKKILNFIF